MNQISIIKWLSYISIIFFFCIKISSAQSSKEETKNEIQEHLNIYEYLISKGDNNQAALRLAKVAVLYWEISMLDSAVIYFTKTANIFEELNQIPELKSIYTNIGAVYSEQNKHKKAIDYYIKSLGLAVETGNEKEIALKQIDLANSYSNNKQHKIAIEIIDKVMDYAKAKNDALLVLTTFNQYVIAYRKNGDEWKAREYELRYNHFYDSIEGENYNLNKLITEKRKSFIEDSLATIVQKEDIAIKDAEAEVESKKIVEAETEESKKDLSIMSREDFLNSRKVDALHGIDTTDTTIDQDSSEEKGIAEKILNKNVLIIFIVLIVAILFFIIYIAVKNRKA
jgi:tetratricopeptide (TPR) repeat protein